MKKILLILLPLLMLQGCSTGGGYKGSEWKTPTAGSASAPAQKTSPAPATPATQPQAMMPAPVTAGAKIKIALLLPLSGNSAAIGEAISNAAQIAVFDSNAENFELIPRDTGGTAAGAAAAAQSAVQDGARLILGPLFADEVRAVAPVAQAANINVIAFTTDLKLAGPRTFVMGFAPADQVRRVLGYAATHGVRSLGVVAPRNDYGDAVMNAYMTQAQASGLQTFDAIRPAPNDPAMSSILQKFSRVDVRRRGDGVIAQPPFDAVFIPAGGSDAQLIAGLLTTNSLPPQAVRRLGTGLWDDPAMLRDGNLNGGWFAAPDPAARRMFEQKYQATYDTIPPRLASLGYDATALAAVLAKEDQVLSGRSGFDSIGITNPNGFAGVDGIFRFRSDGIAERRLAVIEIRNGQAVVIDPAGKTFQSGQ